MTANTKTLNVGQYITRKEISLTEEFNTDQNTWILFQFADRGYIGRWAMTIMDINGNFHTPEEVTFEVMDDDASHLHLSEYEGVFQMRCINMEDEIRALMADLY